MTPWRTYKATAHEVGGVNQTYCLSCLCRRTMSLQYHFKNRLLVVTLTPHWYFCFYGVCAESIPLMLPMLTHYRRISWVFYLYNLCLRWGKLKVLRNGSINYITPARSRPRQKVVIATLAGLLITTIVQLIVQWYDTSSSFVRKPENRLDTFLLSVDDLIPVVQIVTLIAQGMGQILADGIMVNVLYF